MAGAIDRSRLRKLLGLLGSAHDGEVLNAARLIDGLMRQAGLTWNDVIPDGPPSGDATRSADLAKLDQLPHSERVADVLKLRLGAMRAALIAGRLSDTDRRLMRVLHRKAVIDGAVVVEA